jgi:hypothetical protein
LVERVGMSALCQKQTSVSGLEHPEGTGLTGPVPSFWTGHHSLLEAFHPT